MGLAFKQPKGEQTGDSEENPNAEAWQADPTIARTEAGEPATYESNVTKAHIMAAAEDPGRERGVALGEAARILQAAEMQGESIASVAEVNDGGNTLDPKYVAEESVVDQYVEERRRGIAGEYFKKVTDEGVRIASDQVGVAGEGVTGNVDYNAVADNINQRRQNAEKSAVESSERAGEAYDILYPNKK